MTPSTNGHRLHLVLVLLPFLLSEEACGFSSPPHRRNTAPSPPRSSRTAVVLAGNADNALRATQICLDTRSRKLFKEQVKERYPLIPDAALDAGLDWCAKGFKEVAPARLQAALVPGGLEKSKPALIRDLSRALTTEMSTNAQRSPGMAALALLPEKERTKLTEALVGAVVDALIANSPEVLKLPEERLFALEQQVRLVKREMGWWRCTWYRIRRGKWRKKYSSK